MKNNLIKWVIAPAVAYHRFRKDKMVTKDHLFTKEKMKTIHRNISDSENPLFI